MLVIKYTYLQLGPTAELKRTENTQIFSLPCTLALQRDFFSSTQNWNERKKTPLLGLDPRKTDSSWELKHLQRSIYKWKDWHDFKYSVIRNLIIQQQVSNWKSQSNILALSCDLILSNCFPRVICVICLRFEQQCLFAGCGGIIPIYLHGFCFLEHRLHSHGFVSVLQEILGSALPSPEACLCWLKLSILSTKKPHVQVSMCIPPARGGQKDHLPLINQFESSKTCVVSHWSIYFCDCIFTE